MDHPNPPEIKAPPPQEEAPMNQVGNPLPQIVMKIRQKSKILAMFRLNTSKEVCQVQ